MTRHPAPVSPHGFSHPAELPGALDAATAAALLGRVGDVALILDGDGTILDVAVTDSRLASIDLARWKGRRWADTVTDETRGKVDEMLAARDDGWPPRWRQVNHVTQSGNMPIRYLTMRLGDGGRSIAIGRDMRAAATAQQRMLQAQQSLERDYIRLREAETRYRMLFDAAPEPVLMVDAATRRIREANASAHALMQARPGALIDQNVGILVEGEARETLVAFLGGAEIATSPVDLTLPMKRGPGDVRFTASAFRQGRASMLLIRLTPLSVQDDAPAVLEDAIERMPDAFVLADGALRVVAANAAFAELADAGGVDRLRDRPLEEWLGRPGIDLDLIAAQLREHGSVRNVATIVRGAAGVEEECEVSAVLVPDRGQGEHFGFSIRVIARRLGEIADPSRYEPRSVEQLTELVGRMSLKDIVRESTDLIERLCIEAALNYTGDNRASAAELLGLSRQSLYSKLHRHGLGSLGGE
ncbi:transcriptional regulator PpsR [Sphingomonas sp.]